MAFDFQTLVDDAAHKATVAQDHKAPQNAADVTESLNERIDIIMDEHGLSGHIWDRPVPDNVQDAIDALAPYFKESHQAPQIMAKGGPLHTMKILSEALQKAVPAHLQESLNTLLDHIALYLCDYCETAGKSGLLIQFEFKRGGGAS
jgi:hypothetical protein